jgi:dGTPase
MLSPCAVRASESEGRAVDEPQDPVRTCFQRDRDRILHSRAFRRLKGKTQVFIDPVGDHIRTRMTHTLEVAQIARTVGRALCLNEDLIEAIALGHDVGHTPFGHAGEAALDAAIRELGDSAGPAGFRHNEQSLRLLQDLEGLNLCQETCLGIGGHSKGRNDLTAFDGVPTSTLEAAVVRISDRIAYLNHDLDDAARSGVIDGIPDQFQIAPTHAKRIGAMVIDVIDNSQNAPTVRLSTGMLAVMNELKEWLFDHVYLRSPDINPDALKAQSIVRDLFLHFAQPGRLPDGFTGVQGAVDYVSGMTDRFAIETFAALRLPQAFRSVGA